jgi:hypothetical protein
VPGYCRLDAGETGLFQEHACTITQGQI